MLKAYEWFRNFSFARFIYAYKSAFASLQIVLNKYRNKYQIKMSSEENSVAVNERSENPSSQTEVWKLIEKPHVNI